MVVGNVTLFPHLAYHRTPPTDVMLMVSLDQITLQPLGINSYENLFQSLKVVAVAGRRKLCDAVCGLKAISSSQGHET